MRSGLRRQSYLVIGVVLAVAIGYPLCSFLPKMRSIAKVRQEIRDKQDALSETEKLKHRIDEQRAVLASTFQYIDAQRSHLVAANQLSHVYSAISQLAKDAGTTTNRFEPRKAMNYDEFRKVPVTFGVTGPTASLLTLLGEIERLPYTIWVEGLKLDGGGDNGEPARCAIDLAIFVDNRENSN